MQKKVSKILSVVLAIVMLFSAIPLTASAATSGHYTYTVANGKATIENVVSTISGNITIPSTLGGYPVTNIGYGAFYGCTGLTSIAIPNSVTSIGEGAFEACTGLTSVTLPNSVTGIGAGTFFGCTGLTSITIPNSVTSIGTSAFYSCKKLTSITIPNSVTSIGNGAFEECSGLTSITIPKSVTSIGDGAFFGCTGLTSINIPSSVTSIGYYSFSYCKGLTSIIIPKSVTSIEECAFAECSGLTSVTIPTSVTTIGDCAFFGCNNITDVYYTGSEEQWQKINIVTNNGALTNSTIHYNATIEEEDTDEAQASFTNGLSVAQLISQTGKGASITTKDGKAVNEKDLIGTGMLLVTPDGKKKEIVVYGDGDGDGKITSSDARFALRASVGLEKLNEGSCYYKAANVDGEKLSSSDARSILRASVGLDKPEDWIK